MLKINKTILTVFSLLSLIILMDWLHVSNDEMRIIHKENLEKSKLGKTNNLDKKIRKGLELPPNPYYEKMLELSMNPLTGRAEPEKLFELRKQLENQSDRISSRSAAVPGENEEMQWIQRGPVNVGGRTKGIMFDPNDPSNETVFAGGVSEHTGQDCASGNRTDKDNA